MITFMKRLVKHAGRKVFLIVDGHPVHRSKKVREWVAANAKKLALFRLPAYAPELNPDELLNQDVKSNALGRERPPDKQAMVRGVRRCLRQTQRQPQIVANYFQHPDVSYAA